MAKKIGLGLVAVVLAAIAGGWLWLQHMSQATWDPGFFEDDIVAFERADAESPPAPGQILFVGSSSIRMWTTLQDDMAPLSVINRGFGGSQLSHLIHNAARIITPYRPRAIVVYAGDNDLAEGTEKTPEVVLEDWQQFVAAIRSELPDVPIYFLTIKPSIRRWARWPDMVRANAMIAAHNETDPKLGLIDVASPMLGPNGEPAEDMFIIDGLHMTAAGYEAWTAVVRPRLLQEQPEPS